MPNGMNQQEITSECEFAIQGLGRVQSRSEIPFDQRFWHCERATGLMRPQFRGSALMMFWAFRLQVTDGVIGALFASLPMITCGCWSSAGIRGF